MTDPSEITARILRSFAARIRRAGLDLVHPFDAAAYNRAVRDHERLMPVEMFGRDRALGVVVGNSRALWSPFIAALDEDPSLRRSPDPLDGYVRGAVVEALAGVPAAHHLYLSNEGGDRLVSMLHLAEASGLGHRGPAHLAVHRDHGPWFGLRALLVFDAGPLDAAAPRWDSPCVGCAAPCVPALDRALEETEGTPSGQGDRISSWRSWVAVRDACPLGRESRYGENQLRYHYTKDRAALMADEPPSARRPPGGRGG